MIQKTVYQVLDRVLVFRQLVEYHDQTNSNLRKSVMINSWILTLVNPCYELYEKVVSRKKCDETTTFLSVTLMRLLFEPEVLFYLQLVLQMLAFPVVMAALH